MDKRALLKFLDAKPVRFRSRAEILIIFKKDWQLRGFARFLQKGGFKYVIVPNAPYPCLVYREDGKRLFLHS